ncbi:MAG: ATP-binding protein [Lachnospiraceae bacterium]|nr:ATP-binding protein [Lachnospiraceae bacterium]
MKNPFVLTFGKPPIQFISRVTQTNHILDTFRDDNPPSQVYILTGVRGCGKTVMMNDISESFRADDNWIVVELNPERDMLQSLAATLYGIPKLHTLFIKAKLDFSALGLGVSIENVPPVTDIEVAISKMLEQIKKSELKLLITIDEVTSSRNIRTFAAAFQIFVRKNYPVYLIMTGLYENIYSLQNEDSLTFLYRAPKVILEPLNYTAIISQYMKVFKIEREKAEEMAKLTKGYSYAFQVLGYLMWEKNTQNIDDILPEFDQYLEEYVYNKIWSELSNKDRRVIIEISQNKQSKVTSIREALGMKTSEFSVYRDRLKRKGLINCSEYGHIKLLLPRFEEFAIRAGSFEM